ncbi:MAG TPA: hypothetical protein VJM80_10225 [bacterium]|nr:hypothetical protein [bacterium]
MLVHGTCAKCAAPIFLHIDPDEEVYKVRSLRCWNGHYKEIDIIELSRLPAIYAQNSKVVRYIKIVDLDEL